MTIRVVRINVPVTYLLYAALLMAGACSQEKQKREADVVKKNWPAPKVTVLSQLPEKDKPHITLLDTVPEPAVTSIAAGSRHLKVDTIFRNGKKQGQTVAGGANSGTVSTTNGIGFFSTVTTDDGLALDQVNCSFKDKWGYLWFGTNGGGVSRYDGKSFTTYTTANGLASNVIWCITQDHNNNLWFGTDGNGVTSYDGDSFFTYTVAQGLADNVVFSIEEDDDNNLWLGTLKGVSKWDGKRFTNYATEQGLAHNAVKAILKDRQGNIWLGTLRGGVSKWNGTTFTNYTTDEGLIGNRVNCIAEDASGDIWFGTRGQGVSQYDGKTFKSHYFFGDTTSDAVLCMGKDNSGNLWFGTQNSGVIKYDGKDFLQYTTKNGLANNQIRSITQDQKGSLWLATYGSGVCRFAGKSFTNFTTAHGLSGNAVFSIDEDQENNLWMGTSAGISHYNGKEFANFSAANKLAHNEVYCVFKDRTGTLWFGTSGKGVTSFDGKIFTTYTTAQGLANNIVFSIAQDKAGNLWFGTSGGGASKFDGSSFTNYTKSQGLADNAVFCIKEDQNSNLWFGTYANGISKFDGERFTNYSTDQGLADNVVWCITEDRKGNIWVGTQQGLSVLSKDISPSKGTNQRNESRQSLFENFTAQDGLPDNFVTQVTLGVGEGLYVGTNHGMCELLPGSSSKNASSRNWAVGRVFNTQHGYPVKDVNAGLNAMFKDSKGIIWVGTGSDKTGLVRFDPNALQDPNQALPTVYINGLKLNNEAVGWRGMKALLQKTKKEGTNSQAVTDEIAAYGRTLTPAERDSIADLFAKVKFSAVSKWTGMPQQLVLPYYFNNLSFNFGAVETDKNFLVNYRYYLKGYDKEWSPPTRNTYASFGNISEGDYTFMVKAQSPEGVWGEPATFQFKIRPPWWRTWWMYSLYGFILVATVLLFSEWRHRQIIKEKELLEHKVTVATKQVREEAEKVRNQKKQIENTLDELKETQAQLIQSEKMASLGELTAGIAHEIQNPLNFVNNFSEVNKELLEELKEEAEKGNINEVKTIANDVIENSEKIHQHGSRADAIIKGMLQHSRSSTGQKEPTNINVLCDEYLRLAYHGLRAKDKTFNAEFKTDLADNIGSINVVPQDIGRVLLNLITNAFYSVNEKRKTAGNGFKPAVHVTTRKEGAKLMISVWDNGDGVPKPVVDKIFQPFFTTKPTGKGTGLGLSMSYDIITKVHGGSLEVETKEGEYAEFKITLPL